jgi:hypothetical protein
MMDVQAAREKAKAALQPLDLFKGQLGEDVIRNLVYGTEACFYVEKYLVRIRRNGLIEIDPINPRQPS